LLEKEKQLTHMQEEIARQRQAMPWVKIEKEYVFETPEGRKSLADLFGGNSQLVVYHFMLGPGWKAGCVGCSFVSDHVDGANLHLKHHDVSYTAVSRAPLNEIEIYKRRMGWQFDWVSSLDTDFNYDFHVSFRKEEVAKGEVYYNYAMFKTSMEDLHGTSVFYKDETGAIYHTYSTYARGDERGIGAYTFLDMTPKGRNETGPGRNLTDWVKRHDEYQNGGSGEQR
jgi:predicted dithiol-disulfide oxidoreductase (DUF899 family)